MRSAWGSIWILQPHPCMDLKLYPKGPEPKAPPQANPPFPQPLGQAKATAQGGMVLRIILDYFLGIISGIYLVHLLEFCLGPIWGAIKGRQYGMMWGDMMYDILWCQRQV